MPAALAVFLITLGLAQTTAAWFGWRALSLVGPGRWRGLGVGLLLLFLGGLGLTVWGPTPSWPVLVWTLPAVPLALAMLLWAGSVVRPPRHPDALFTPHHPAHGRCQRLDLPDGANRTPAYLLHPPPGAVTGGAVCLLHGSGDSKRSFKWRLVQALLEQGLIVLTLDLPGHGENQDRPLSYPDCLSVLPAGVTFLRDQPGVERVGVLGISLGAAIALATLTTRPTRVDALALLEMPLWVHYSPALVRREAWRALRAPVLDLFGEISLAQIRRSWQAATIRSRHSTAEIFQLLAPAERIGQLDPRLPLFLVYSQADPIAPLAFGKALKETAPQARLLAVRRASHITLTLMRPVNRQVAEWLGDQLGSDL